VAAQDKRLANCVHMVRGSRPATSGIGIGGTCTYYASRVTDVRAIEIRVDVVRLYRFLQVDARGAAFNQRVVNVAEVSLPPIRA